MILASLAVFSWVAVLLAAVGRWESVSRSVADRNRELGLRDGVGGRVLASGMLESILWSTAPWDPLTYGVGAVLLMAILMLASYVWAASCGSGRYR